MPIHSQGSLHGVSRQAKRIRGRCCHKQVQVCIMLARALLSIAGLSQSTVLEVIVAIGGPGAAGIWMWAWQC